LIAVYVKLIEIKKVNPVHARENHGLVGGIPQSSALKQIF
jgi:hypothetical protein